MIASWAVCVDPKLAWVYPTTEGLYSRAVYMYSCSWTPQHAAKQLRIYHRLTRELSSCRNSKGLPCRVAALLACSLTCNAVWVRGRASPA